MKNYQKDDLLCFAEWVPYDEKEHESKETARKYLRQWKKYLLWKLRNELCNYEPYDGDIIDGDKKKIDPEEWYVQWIDRPSIFSGCIECFSTLVLKFCLKKNFPYQIGTGGITTEDK